MKEVECEVYLLWRSFGLVSYCQGSDGPFTPKLMPRFQHQYLDIERTGCAGWSIGQCQGVFQVSKSFNSASHLDSGKTEIGNPTAAHITKEIPYIYDLYRGEISEFRGFL